MGVSYVVAMVTRLAHVAHYVQHYVQHMATHVVLQFHVNVFYLIVTIKCVITIISSPHVVQCTPILVECIADCFTGVSCSVVCSFLVTRNESVLYVRVTCFYSNMGSLELRDNNYCYLVHGADIPAYCARTLLPFQHV